MVVPVEQGSIPQGAIAQPGRVSAPGKRRAAGNTYAMSAGQLGRHRIRQMRREAVVKFTLGIFEGAVLGRRYSVSSVRGLARHREFLRAAYLDTGRIYKFQKTLLEALPDGFKLAQKQWRIEDVSWHSEETEQLEVERDAFVVDRLDGLDLAGLNSIL